MSENPSIRRACEEVKRRVDRALEWKDDRETMGMLEHWQSHAREIIANEEHRYYDDCDGFALTSAQLLMEQYDIDPGAVRLVLCLTPGGHHVFCAVDDEEAGETYCLDNNMDRVVSPARLRREEYKLMSYMDFARKGVWRAITDVG
jgi:predicted transglutaminase-like cysteine proteinase